MTKKILIIAEKPSVARAIVDALPGHTERLEGYFKNGDYLISFFFGHMMELAPPEFYNPAYKNFRVENHPLQINDFVLQPSANSIKQFNLIGRLLKVVDVVVNCGDPDREGQLLVDEVLEHYGWNRACVSGKTMRMLLNSTDPSSVRTALRNMEDNQKYRNLYAAGCCRRNADYLVGYNLTPLASVLLSGNQALISVGRVQSPTLWLLVKRDNEIDNFIPKNFWTLRATVSTPHGEIELSHNPSDDASGNDNSSEEGRIYDKKVADQIVTLLRGKSVPLAVSVTNKRESPSKPYTLVSFSKDAGKKLGWKSAKCTEVLQSLYEKGLATYPRTEIEYLKDEHIPMVPGLVSVILNSGLFQDSAHLPHHITIRKNVFDSAKVIEHHAIIPTMKAPPSDLPNDLRSGWKLIAERFLKCVLPDYEYKETIVTFKHGDRVFKCRGAIPINLNNSWRFFEEPTVSILPDIQDGYSARILDCKSVAGKTTPPSRYTETDLMADMSSVAKYVEDPRFKARLKESSGIGTPATRTAIIKTLMDRGYAEAKGKHIVSTPFGKSVIATLPPMLTDPGLTALWEEALDHVQKGSKSSDDFMNGIKGFVNQRISDLKTIAEKGGKVTGFTPRNQQKAGSVSPRTGGQSISVSGGRASTKSPLAGRTPPKPGRRT